MAVTRLRPVFGGMDELLERGEPLFRALSGAHIFLTGGTGFFGRWLLEAVHSAGARLGVDICVTVISRDPRRFASAVPHLADASWLTLELGDVRDFDLPRQHFSHLIHAATDTSARAAAKPLERLDSMVMGTRRVLDFAVDCHIQDGLLTSSGAVYGHTEAGRNGVSELSLAACDCSNPDSDYAEGKRMAELMCALVGRENGLKMRIARCFSFAGPGLPLRGHFAVGNFVADALAGNVIRVRGDGRPIRSYLYAGDLVLWLLTILLRGDALRPYNVGSDRPMSIREIAERVRDLLAPATSVVIQTEMTGGSVSYYLPNIERARRELGLDVWTDFDDAVHYMADWSRSKSEGLK